MSRTVTFKSDESLIRQGEEECVAYLIQSGWVVVEQQRESGTTFQARVGPGEIVGELAMTGLVSQRSASATALTDVEAEVIDRGALIRLVNGPGSRMTPILAALLSRLKSVMVDEKDENRSDHSSPSYAIITGLNSISKQALCNKPCTIPRLPWTFGAHVPPQSVTDLFRNHEAADILLGNASKRVREHHIRIEASSEKGLQLHLMHLGDYCEVDEKRVGYGPSSTTVPLQEGYHTVYFGDPVEPYKFGIEVLSQGL